MRLITCGKKKRAGIHPAKDLYTGPLFKVTRAWAEQSPDGQWGILSAKHGFVHPEKRIQCYDTLLTKKDVDAWLAKTIEMIPDCGLYELVGPKLYTQSLAAELKWWGEVTIVGENQRLGKKMSIVKNLTEGDFPRCTVENPVQFCRELYNKMWKGGEPIIRKRYIDKAVEGGALRATASACFSEFAKGLE